MPFNYTFRADDLQSVSSEDRDLLENRDRELELYLNQPELKIARVANQSVASTVTVFVAFDTEIVDTANFFAPTSNTITVPIGAEGMYGCYVAVDLSVTNTCRLRVLVNGNAINFYNQANNYLRNSCILNVAVGDTIQASIENLGASMSLFTASLRMVRIMA